MAKSSLKTSFKEHLEIATFYLLWLLWHNENQGSLKFLEINQAATMQYIESHSGSTASYKKSSSTTMSQ